MLDSIDINYPDKPSAASPTSWFDAINPNVRPAVLGRDSSSFVSSGRRDVAELTPSTIRYNEDSGSPRGLLSVTQSPVDPQRENSRAGFAGNSPGETAASDTSPFFGMVGAAQPSPRSRHGDLYDDAMRAQLGKRQWVAMEQMRQQMLENAKTERDCPFKPKLSSYAAKIQRPAELAPHNRVYNELLRKEEWRAKKRQEHIEKELEGCTFRPLTLRAATLKSSAHMHDSHVFSELYNHHEEQNRFLQEVQPYVVEQLERHMLFKNPSNKPLPEDKINAVVERLFSRGVVVQPDETKRKKPRSTSPSFKPTITPNSARLVARQREGGLVVEDVVQRLFKPSPSPVHSAPFHHHVDKKEIDAELNTIYSEYNRELRELLSRERQRSFISAKFDILSNAINKHRQKRDGVTHSVTEHSVEELVNVATLLLSPDEAREFCNIVSLCGFTKLNKEGFLALYESSVGGRLDPNKSPLARLPPPRITTIEEAYAMIAEKRGEKEGVRKTFQREIPPPELLEEMNAKREERRRQLVEEHKKRQAMLEGELGEGAFHPPPPRKIPRECHMNYHVDVKTTKADMLCRTHIQKTLEQEDNAGAFTLPLASTKDLFGAGVGKVCQKLHRSHSMDAGTLTTSRNLRTKPALVEQIEAPRAGKTPSANINRHEKRHRSVTAHGERLLKSKGVVDAPRKHCSSRDAAAVSSDHSSEDAANTMPRRMQKRESAAVTTTSPRVYRDVISEHAAFGRDGALTDFGRELLLRQLREYRERRK